MRYDPWEFNGEAMETTRRRSFELEMKSEYYGYQLEQNAETNSYINSLKEKFYNFSDEY